MNAGGEKAWIYRASADKSSEPDGHEAESGRGARCVSVGDGAIAGDDVFACESNSAGRLYSAQSNGQSSSFTAIMMQSQFTHTPPSLERCVRQHCQQL